MKRLAAIALLLPIVWLFALPVPPIQHSPWTTTTNDPSVTLQAQQPVSITTTNTVAFVANGLMSTTNTINATLNVQSFGAKSDGSDATAAIQSAINTCAVGGEVLFPNGVYTISSPLVISSPITLRGVSAAWNATVKSGAWLSWSGPTNQWMVVITNKPGDVLFSVKIVGLAFNGNHLANGILAAPPAHPQSQHGFVYDSLYLYRCLIGLGFGTVLSDNQTDSHTFINLAYDELDTTFADVWARNFTCCTFIGCHGNLLGASDGQHYYFHAGSQTKLLNCVGGFGRYWTRGDYLMGNLSQDSTEWETSNTNSPTYHLQESPGPGNNESVIFKDCIIQDPIVMNQNERHVVLMGNSIYQPVYLNANLIQLYDSGNSYRYLFGTLTNATFTNGLAGWAQTGTNWFVDPATNAVWHAPGVGASNAITQTISVASNMVYNFFFYMETFGGTNGFVVPVLGSQAGVPMYPGTGGQFSAFTNLVSGTAALGFVPSTNFDGAIGAISYTYQPVPFVDLGTANHELSLDILRASYGGMLVGTTHGEAAIADGLSFDLTNLWLRVGSYNNTSNQALGKLTVNSTTREHSATIYGAGNEASIEMENPFGGSFAMLGASGSFSGLLHDTNSVLYIGVRPQLTSSTNAPFEGVDKQTAIEPSGAWIFGWDGATTNTGSKVFVKGGFSSDFVRPRNMSISTLPITDGTTNLVDLVNQTSSVLVNNGSQPFWLAASSLAQPLFAQDALGTNWLVTITNGVSVASQNTLRASCILELPSDDIFNSDMTFDISGWENNGLVAGATAPYVTNGMFGNSFYYSGASYLNCGTGAKLLGATNALTVMGWVKFSSAANMTLFSRIPVWCVEVDAGKIYASVSANGVLWTKQVNTTTTFDDDAWHHVAMVFVPSTSLTIYVDGTSQASSSTGVPAALNVSGAEVVVAAVDNGGFGTYYTGRIDQVMIFTRALTGTELSTYWAHTLAK